MVATRPRGETIARLIRHPVRAHALLAYAEAETSPSRIAAELNAAVNLVSYHTQVLRRSGAIELVRTEPRRGAKEHFYRAVLPGDIEDAEWENLPLKLRRVLVRGVIDGVMRQAADALPHGGMDRAPTHVSRNYFLLDRRAAQELASLLYDTVTRARAIALASRRRGDKDAAAHELVIMSFERASRP